MLASLFAILPLLGAALAAPAGEGSTSHLSKRDVDIVRNCNVPGQVALTFDDGPGAYATDLINTLGDNKATFFVSGSNYNCIYDQADVL